MSGRSSKEKPSSLIYLISETNSYNVATDNLNDFYEKFKNRKSMWYLENMLSSLLIRSSKQLVYYWSLQFPNIQVLYSYGPIYNYLDKTNGVILKRPDTISKKSNLELRLYKKPRIKAYFLEWILPNDKEFNSDYFITDYNYYIDGIQWLKDNLGLEAFFPSKTYATYDRYIKFQKDKYTYNKASYPLNIFNNVNELNKKLDELLVDQTTVTLHPNFQRIPRSQQNAGKKKSVRKVK